MEDLVGVLALSAARDFVKRAQGMGAPPGSSGFAPGVGYGSVSRYGGMGYGFGGPMMNPGYSQLHQLAMVRNPAQAYMERQEERALAHGTEADVEQAKIDKLHQEVLNAARQTSAGAADNWAHNYDPKYHQLIDPKTGTPMPLSGEFKSYLFGSGENGLFGINNPTEAWNRFKTAHNEYTKAYSTFAARKKMRENLALREQQRAAATEGMYNRFQADQIKNQGTAANAESSAYGRAYDASGRPGVVPPALAPVAPAPPPSAPPSAPSPAPRPPTPPAPKMASGRLADDVVDRLARAAALMKFSSASSELLPLALGTTGAAGGWSVPDDGPGRTERAFRGALIGGGAGAGAGFAHAHLGKHIGLLSIPAGALAGAAVGGLLSRPLAALMRNDSREEKTPPKHDPYVMIPRESHTLTPDDLASMAAEKGATARDDDVMPLPELDTHMKALHPRRRGRRPGSKLSPADVLARSAASRPRDFKEAGDAGVGELARASARRGR